MEYKMKLIIAVICICLFPAWVFAGIKPIHPALLIGHYQIITENVHQTDLKFKYYYDINYPQITGKNLSDPALQFNAAIKNRVTENIVALKKSVSSPADIKALKNINALNTLNIDYDIAVINPLKIPLISVRFTIHLDQLENAAANTFHEMFNYNLKTGVGKNITLESLFIPDSKYEKVLSNYYAPKLRKINGVTERNIEVITGNPLGWNFRPDGLLLTFDDLSIKVGPREVLVPYSILKNVVSIYSPIAICTKHPAKCKN
jgi:hypothetical protein